MFTGRNTGSIVGRPEAEARVFRFVVVDEVADLGHDGRGILSPDAVGTDGSIGPTCSGLRKQQHNLKK